VEIESLMFTDFGRVLLFFIVGGVFVALGLFAAWILRPKRPSTLKLSTYECGETPVGSPWIRFNVRFYVIALIFLIFDVEVVFLFPWALVFKQLGMFAFLEMVVFIVILGVGFIYAWVKGDLDWDKPAPRIPQYKPGVGVTAPSEKEISA
jgi:NADH-quinone oxidoreductase subunit A